jgi:glycine cleavage system aminomethyltransferase T
MMACVLQVEVSDISAKTAVFTVCGPTGGKTLAAIGASTEEMQQGHHGMMQCSGSPVILAAGSSLGSPDWTLIVDERAAAELWRSITSKVARHTNTKLRPTITLFANVLW